MADQSLEILIKTIADSSGITLTDAQLGKLKTTLSSVGVETESLAEKTMKGVEKDKERNAETEEAIELLKQRKDALVAFGGATDDVDAALSKLGVSEKESGHHAGNARMQHMALHHAFAQLNKIAPGLGTTLNMLTRGMHSAGDSAEGAAEKMRALTTSIGPLIVIMMTIELATKMWEAHKQKIKEVADEQERTAKRTSESLHKMVEDYTAAQEAMHPKVKTEAEKKEDALKKTIRGIDAGIEKVSAEDKAHEDVEIAAVKTKKSKDKAVEEAELKASDSSQHDFIKEKHAKIQAALDAEEEKIKKAYEVQAKRLAEYKLVVTAGAEKQAAGQMGEAVKKDVAGIKKLVESPEEKAAYLKASGQDAEGLKFRAAIENAHKGDWQSFVPGSGKNIEGFEDYFNPSVSHTDAGKLTEQFNERMKAGGAELQEIQKKTGALSKDAVEEGTARDKTNDSQEETDFKARAAQAIDTSVAGIKGEKFAPVTSPNEAVPSVHGDDERAKQLSVSLNSGVANLLKINSEMHDGLHKNIGNLIAQANEQKQKNIELDAQIRQLRGHGGL